MHSIGSGGRGAVDAWTVDLFVGIHLAQLLRPGRHLVTGGRGLAMALHLLYIQAHIR